MADKELQTVLNSGELTGIKLGGTATANEVATKADIEASIISVGTHIAQPSQTLVAGVEEQLFYFDTQTILIGADLVSNVTTDTITIVTSATYKIGGTITAEAANKDVIDIHLAVNGADVGLHNSMTGRGAGKKVTVSYFGAISLSAADELTLSVESTGTSIIVDASSMVIEKIS
jgi:hypothetical protein